MSSPIGVLGASIEDVETSYGLVNAYTTPQSNMDYSINPFADNINWIFMVDSAGKTYMCQFNHSADKWIGDWILVP